MIGRHDVAIARKLLLNLGAPSRSPSFGAQASHLLNTPRQRDSPPRARLAQGPVRACFSPIARAASLMCHCAKQHSCSLGS
jgi:hypothetical protein